MDDLAAARPGALTARRAGLVACTSCGRLSEEAGIRCPRCGAMVHSRAPQGLQKVWAWLLAGMILYVPANVYPMMITRSFGEEYRSTILGGVVELFDHGAWFVAVIVLVASVVIPVAKFLVIGFLAWSVHRGSSLAPKARIHLYEIVEFIGRWSMIDVFVVAILAALVQLGFVASINPGFAAICFALSVVLTMLSAQSFDPRLIWDAEERRNRG